MIFGKYINRFYLKYAPHLLLGLFALWAVDYLQLIIPELYQMVINGMNQGYVMVDGVQQAFDMAFLLDKICMPMVGVAVAIVFGRFLWRVSIFGAAIRVETNLRDEMFDHAKNLSREYYQQNKVGNLMSLFTNDLDTVQECYGWGFMQFFDALILGTMSMAKMWQMNHMLAVLSLIPMALLFVCASIVGRVMTKKWDYRQECFSRLSDFSQESFSGIAVIKAFVKETLELLAFKKLNDENEAANIDFTKTSVLMRIMVGSFVESVMCIIIGYGGYLKLALQFPEFVDYVESVCKEFRELYENIKGTTPYCVKRVAVLNCWGKMRAWGCHMVHHALYYKQNYSYSGVIEMLSGAPFDVKFISFEDIKNDPKLLETVDVIINVGDADTAHTGGIWWEDPEISSAIRRFVWNGGGFIGVGEPSGHPYQGHILQMASVLGVEEENGFTLNYDKYNWEEHPNHFILQDADQPIDFGEGKKNIYALEGTEVLVQRNKEVQMAAHDFGKGRAVYISGVPYSFANSRTLYRAILWSAHSEDELHTWFSSNYNVEVHAYVKNGKYCVVNNTYEPQDTTVYTTEGNSFDLHLDANEIRWYEI